MIARLPRSRCRRARRQSGRSSGDQNGFPRSILSPAWIRSHTIACLLALCTIPMRLHGNLLRSRFSLRPRRLSAKFEWAGTFFFANPGAFHAFCRKLIIWKILVRPQQFIRFNQIPFLRSRFEYGTTDKDQKITSGQNCVRLSCFNHRGVWRHLRRYVSSQDVHHFAKFRFRLIPLRKISPIWRLVPLEWPQCMLPPKRGSWARPCAGQAKPVRERERGDVVAGKGSGRAHARLLRLLRCLASASTCAVP